MTADGQNCHIEAEGLTLGRSVISFQRYLRPREGVISEIPASCGALPLALADGVYLLPLADDEAFWIGVLLEEDTQAEIVLSMLGDEGRLLADERYARRGMFVLGGIPLEPHRLAAFCRDSVSRLRITSGRIEIDVVPTSRERFVAQSGCAPPPPLNPDSAYKGWRLP